MTASAMSQSQHGYSGCPLSQSIEYGWVGSRSSPYRGGSRVLYVGGNGNTNAGNATQYGLSAANSNNDLSNSNANIGARLSFVRRITVDTTLPAYAGRKQESIRRGLVILLDERPRDKQRHIMRTEKRIYPEICDMSNLDSASKDACSSRKDKAEVARFMADRDTLLAELQRMMVEHTIPPAHYRHFERKERGKVRDIADVPLYPYRIMEMAIANVIEPRLVRRMTAHSYASIPGRGCHMVIQDMERRLHNDPRISYVLVMDIDQFFKSMDPERVKLTLRHYIGDPELLWLLDQIIDSYDGPGIALGGRLSPIFANLYLNDLDHDMEERWKVHYHWRYMDNFFIFGYSKPWLHRIEDRTIASLGEKGLVLNEGHGVMPVDEVHGFDCLGYVVYRNHVRLRKSTKKRMISLFREVDRKLDGQQVLTDHDRGGIASYLGVLKWCDSYNLKRKYVFPVLRKLKDSDNWVVGCRSYRLYLFNNREIYR